MSRVPIDCPHCGKTTRVDLAQNLSTQKCDRCGIRFSAVDTGLAGSREVQLTEPPEWRRAKTGAWDEDPETTPPRPTATTGSRTAWIVAATALALVAVAALAIALRPPTTAPVPPATEQPASPTSAEGAPASTYLSLRERIDAATAAAESYLSARTVDDLLPLIENSTTLEPEVRAHYTEGAGKDSLPLREFTLAPIERQLWIDAFKAVVISYETPGQMPRALALRQAADGRWLVDWPSAAAISDMPLSTFRAERPNTPTFFRVLATPDDYYNRDFANDREWLCLRLTEPTQQHRLYAYVRRGTPLAQQLLKAPLGRPPAQTPIMLKLRFPANARANDQVEITEFLGMGWILNPSPPAPSPTSPPAPQ